MERYRDPRVLQCAHHFCKVCLEEIADRHPQGSVTCPTCRHVTPIEGDTSITSLPKYRVVNDFIGNVNAAIEDNTNVKLDRYCDVCKDNNRTRATRFCFGCSISLCDPCNNHKHTRLGSYQGHRTFPISSHMFCSSHENKFNVLHCKRCEQMCSPLSAIEEHAEHEYYPIEEETTDIHIDIQNVIFNMKNVKEENMISAKIHFLLEKAKTKQSDFKAAISNIKAGIQQLEAKVAKIAEEVLTSFSAEIKHLEMTACDLDDYKDSKEKLKNHLIFLAEEASNQELFVRQRELPKFEPNFFKKLISKPEVELPVLGNTLREITAQLDKYQQELTIHYDKYIMYNDGKVGAPLVNLKKITDLNVGDNICGLTVDSVRERLVVRRMDTTAPITVYDFQGQQLQVLGKDVEGIADGKDKCIAIDTKRNVYILPMENGSLGTMDMNGTIMDQFKLIDSSLYGAAYCETDFYVTSRLNPHQVYLIDPNTKQKMASFAPNTTFSYPYNVHSCLYSSGSVTKPVIIVSDWNSHCIKVLDMSGHLLHTYGKEGKEGQGDGELYYPWVVCTDPGGRIIVWDRDNGRVVSFWSEGDNDIWEVLLDKDKLPNNNHPTVVCDPVTRRLFVAFSNNTNILVFE